MTEKVKIDKGVKMPSRKYTGPPLKYPWPDMRVSDSFGFKAADANKIKNAAKSWQRRNKPDWKFSLRTMGDEGRIWRVK